MAFRDLDEFLVVEPVELPIRGKTYKFPGEISARSWLKLQRLSSRIAGKRRDIESGRQVDPDEVIVSDTDEFDLMEEMLGDTQQEMLNDGVSSGELRAVFYTLMAYHISGVEAAEEVWNIQGEASSRPTSRATPQQKGSSGARKKSTRSRGSRAGSNGKTQEKKASRGSTSSKTGS